MDLYWRAPRKPGDSDRAGEVLLGRSPRLRSFMLMLWILFLPLHAIADVDLPTKFTNMGGVRNTRHNLNQRQASGPPPYGTLMDAYRSDYAEVCVYCHTPHGAHRTAKLPLWNRTIKVTTYQTYSSNTLTGAVAQPGANSLACLSCHDGQLAIDSIINMPGSGRYLASQETSQNNTFLNTWSNPSTTGPFTHIGLDSNINNGCLACHSPAAGFVGAGATDFTVAALGTDLRNDHPIGVKLPIGPEWAVTDGAIGTTKFFDTNTNGRLDKNDVRFYDSGDGPKVECATCHDPHGVPSGGAGSAYIPTFMRKSNSGSALCLVCHVK